MAFFYDICGLFMMLFLFSAVTGKHLRNHENVRRNAMEGIYDWRAANASVSLSALSYCGNETILSGNYSESIYVDDFIPTNIIYNKYYDVNGFIGISKNERAIYVVFRGSETITNWLDDFETLMTTYPLCPQCSVHAGFYYSSLSVKDDVVHWTQALQKDNPTFDVVVAGHSLGGALATLTAVNLIINDITNVRHFSFGSPRVGNTAAAIFISSLLPEIYRTTHYKDIVPHNPFTNFGYKHVSGEWYENDQGKLSQCMGYEDVHCADQWTLEEDIADHMKYLGRSMWCTFSKQ